MIGRALRSLLFPPSCCGCGARPVPSAFCGACAAELEVPTAPRCACCAAPLRIAWGSVPTTSLCPACEEARPAFASATGIFVHGGSIARAIHRFKYRGKRELAGPLGELLGAVASELASADLIAPIPLHRARRRHRGYDQAELLARTVARTAKVPFGAPLRRIRDTPPQVGRSREERLENVRGAFVVAAPVDGRSIVLVDDVITTCATARTASVALLRAGAREVRVIALARAGD